MDEFWKEIRSYRDIMTKSGEFEEKRKKQALAWMWSMIESGLHYRFRNHPSVHAALPELSRDIEAGRVTPGAAAHTLLDFLGSH
jgi:LAO/AO transport system kinase